MFLDLVLLARENDDYSGVWPAFLEGFWCVLVEPLEQPVNGQDFRFVVREFGPGKEPTIFVAEKAEQLASADVRHSIRARGSDLLAMLHAEVGHRSLTRKRRGSRHARLSCWPPERCGCHVEVAASGSLV